MPGRIGVMVFGELGRLRDSRERRGDQGRVVTQIPRPLLSGYALNRWQAINVSPFQDSSHKMLHAKPRRIRPACIRD